MERRAIPVSRYLLPIFSTKSGYQVDLITTTFQHWEKAQRDMEKIKKEDYQFGIKFIYEPGYKKNVDLKRILLIDRSKESDGAAGEGRGL